MPHPGIKFLKQKAVLWAADGFDDYGQPRVSSTGIEINVRWESKKRQIHGPNNTTISVDATAVVDRDIAVHSAMWLGELENWVGTGYTGADVMEVIAFDTLMDLKGRKSTRRVTLARFRDTLPEQV